MSVVPRSFTLLLAAALAVALLAAGTSDARVPAGKKVTVTAKAKAKANAKAKAKRSAPARRTATANACATTATARVAVVRGKARGRRLSKLQARRRTVIPRCRPVKGPSRQVPPAPAPGTSTSKPPAKPSSPQAPAAPTAPVTVTPPASDFVVGLNADSQGWNESARVRQDAAAPTGVKWLREEIRWEAVQPTRGTWDWRTYDAVFRAAAQRGITVLPLLIKSPTWAAADWRTIPADPTDFATFAARVAERYGEGGTFWVANPTLTAKPATWYEIWNEAYHSGFSGTGYDPPRYARLVQAAATAIRGQMPSAKIVMAADLTGDWIDDLYAAVPDLSASFDAVAVHPYAIDLESRQPNPLSYGFPRTVEGIRQLLVNHGAADKALWITEIGASTCPGGTQSFCVSEARQAEILHEIYTKATTTYKDYVRGVFFYSYADWGPRDGNREHYFGLTRPDGSWKPAFTALRQISGVA